MRVYAVSPFKFHRFYLAWGHYAERKKSYAKLEILKGTLLLEKRALIEF
jgi:hypothetical protein